MANSWYLYIIRTVDGNLYTGITTDVNRRFKEHLSQSKLSAKYLLAHKPLKIVFQAQVENHSIALKLEYRLKKLTKHKKEQIIKMNKIIYDKISGDIIL